MFYGVILLDSISQTCPKGIFYFALTITIIPSGGGETKVACRQLIACSITASTFWTNKPIKVVVCELVWCQLPISFTSWIWNNAPSIVISATHGAIFIIETIKNIGVESFFVKLISEMPFGINSCGGKMCSLKGCLLMKWNLSLNLLNFY